MIKIIDLHKIPDDYEYVIKQGEDINIVPSSFNKESLSKNLRFVVNDSNLNQKIFFKTVAESDNVLDINITLSTQNIDIKNIKVSLEAIILNIGQNNQIKVHPNLEIPQKNITFEHKFTIGSPNKSWIAYMKSRGLSSSESLELIRKSFLEL